jgi:hypothetical protein
MLTSRRCLAKADELDAYLPRSASDLQRKAYHDVATGWRWVATLAAAQEALATKAQVGLPCG